MATVAMSEPDCGATPDHKVYTRESPPEQRILHGKYLREAEFHDCDLRGFEFQGANLDGADFTHSDLDRAQFQDASLRGARLKDARNLSTEALGGADLTGAELPEGLEGFAGLDGVAEASRNLQSVFRLILGLSAFSLLTIFTKFERSPGDPPPGATLKFLGATVSQSHFGWIAPLILLILFLYLTTYLSETWIRLSKLPAVFPDGSPLDRRAYPLSLNCLIRQHFFRLRDKPPAPHELVIAHFFMFWICLPTLALFWLFYLDLRVWWVSLLQAAWLSMALQLALYHWIVSIVVLGERGWRTTEAGPRGPADRLSRALRSLNPSMSRMARTLAHGGDNAGRPPSDEKLDYLQLALWPSTSIFIMLLLANLLFEYLSV